MKRFSALLLFFCCLLASDLKAQDSAIAQFMSAHSMNMLTADSVNPDHHDLVITALAAQNLAMTGLPPRPAQPALTAQAKPQPCVLQIDTASGRAELLSLNGHHLADVHLAIVDSSWYMWLSVDPLADQNLQNSPYMYCSGNPIMRIDPDGCFDKEETLDGLKHMGQGGVDGVVAFVAWIAAPETAGASALIAVPMTIEGYSEFQVGFGRFLDGLFSDSYEGKMERIQQMPTSLFNAIAKGIDQAMGNENKEIETVVDVFKIISGKSLKIPQEMKSLQKLSDLKTVKDVTDFINEAMKVPNQDPTSNPEQINY